MFHPDTGDTGDDVPTVDGVAFWVVVVDSKKGICNFGAV